MVVAAGMVVAASASAESPDKWGASIDLEGKLGTDRHLGEADLLIPLFQNADTLLFGDIRTRLDDGGSKEGNFGAGARHMLDSGWNLGAYGYFDRRRTENDSLFNQLTFGAEALGRDWDARVNSYWPIGETTRLVDSLNTAAISGTSVIFRGGEERALRGFDAEVGWRAPVFEADGPLDLRLYAGGFTFDDGDVPDVTGPRLRAELTGYDLPELAAGARVTLGAEWQYDDVRDGQAFFSARLRIPLQSEAQRSRKLTAQERRMTAPIVRDVDIVAQAGAFGAPETATQLANGNTFTIFNSATTTGAALPGAVAGAGSNVILSGTFSTTATVTLNAGQSLMGSGVSVRSASGRTAILSNSATMSATGVNSSGAVGAANNSTISGLSISNTSSAAAGANGILVNGVSGVTISNNTIRASELGANSTNGVVITGGGSATVTGNTISAVANNNAGIAAAINLFNGTATIANNTLSASGSTNANRFLALSNGVTVNSAASTGNTATAGVCANFGATGFASFTDGTTCP